MISELSPNAILNQVATSLVAKQRYSSVEEAVLELALTAIRNKTVYYRRRIRKFENKYGADFDKFTARLKNKAGPDEEDDWLSWKSARNMLADWQKVCQDLLHEYGCNLIC